MNPILSSSFSRMLGAQGELPWWQGSQEMDTRGFFKDMGGLERASTRLADRAAGREMLLQKQKAEEESGLESQRAALERRRLKLMSRLEMK